MNINELFLESLDSGNKINWRVHDLKAELSHIKAITANNNSIDPSIFNAALNKVKDIKRLIYDLQLGISFVTTDIELADSHNNLLIKQAAKELNV